MAIKYISKGEYRAKQERMLQRYENAGLTPVDCMTDITNAKGQVCYADGYADGALVGGIALTIAGLICKALARRESKDASRMVDRRLSYAISVKPLTDFNIPGTPEANDENREENTD